MNSLFDVFDLFGQRLQNRMVLAPMTRNRVLSENLLPNDLMKEYYQQRSSAGLLVSEGIVISRQGGSSTSVPGLYDESQVEAWKPITAAVHQGGGVFYAQLWHVGRLSHTKVQPDGQLPVGPSAIAAKGFEYRAPDGPVPYEVPEELSLKGISRIVDDYVAAAKAATAAGFDGIEIHAANGYLIDQFLNTSSNQRTDEYGGSIGNRAKFLFEVIDAIATVIDRRRIGVRLSPSNTFLDVTDYNKKALFTFVVDRLSLQELSYLHLVEPHYSGRFTADEDSYSVPSAHYRQHYGGTLIVTGGHDQYSAHRLIEEGNADLVGFGRLFIANPDLPARFRLNASLLEPDRSTFYTGGSRGYTDYPALTARAN